MYRRGTGGKGLAEQAGEGAPGRAKESGADLRELTDGDDVDVGSEVKVLEGKEFGGPAVSLDLVDDDGDAAVADFFEEGEEEVAVTGVEAPFTLDEFAAEGCILAGITGEVGVESGEGALSAACGIGSVVEGEVVDGKGRREATAEVGFIGDLGEGEGAAHEAAGEGQHPVGRGALVEAELEGVFIGDGAGAAEEAVVEAREVEEAAHQGVGVVILLEVALDHDIAEGGIDGSGDESGVAMAEVVGADAADEVVLDAAIEEFDEGSSADAAAEVRVPEVLAAHRV